MKKWQDIPTEILNHIFRNLQKKDVGRCSLTCRAWKFTAQRILFEQLTPIDSSDMYRLITLLSTSPSHSSDYQSPGNFVKALKVCYYTGFDIAIVDKLFPFVQVISNDGYIDPFKKKLYRLLKEGGFRNLKKTPFTMVDKDHLELILTRKDSIKELELRITNYDSFMDGLLEVLPLLRSLEILQLEFAYGELSTSVETILSGIPPTSKSINLTFTVNSKVTLNTLHPSDTRSLPAAQSVSINNSGMFYMEEKDYVYIMKKFPNVEFLELRFNPSLKILDKSDYTVPTVQSILQFFVYLFNIRRGFAAPAIGTNQSTADVVKALFDHALSKKSSCATFRNVEIHLKLTLKPTEGDAHFRDHTACIIPTNEHSNTKKLCKVEVAYKMIWNSTPYLELFQKIANTNIECLTIEDCSWIYPSSKRVLISLDAVLDHCTSLKKLIFDLIDDFTFTEELFIMEEKPKSNIECLILHACGLKQNMFPYISALCPNLKVLQLNDCSFPSQPGTDHRPNLFKYVHINMPSTRLQELHFSVLANPDDLYEDTPYYLKTVIRFKTFEGETNYYKISLGSLNKDGDFVEDIRHFRCTKANFEEGIKDELCLVYHIYCESIANLFIQTETEFPSF